jgi:transcriptional regulator with XRE-family HTH domain
MVRNGPATTRTKSTRGGGTDTEKLKRLGKAIRLLRVSRELTQGELAASAGVSTSHVWALESGKKEPGVLLLERIANALGVPLELFLVAVTDPLGDRTAAERETFVEGRRLMMSLLEGIAGVASGEGRPTAKKKSRSS